MILTADEIVKSATGGFVERYPQFKDLCQNPEHFAYWKLCLQTLQDRDLLGHILFCNDVFCIPPMKTFLFAHTEELCFIAGNREARLPDFVKKALGAFWGYVFKVVFCYAGQKSVSVSLNRQFFVKTATYYTDPQKKLVLAW